MAYGLRPRKTKREPSPLRQVAPKLRRTQAATLSVRSHALPKQGSPFQNFRTIRMSPYRSSPARQNTQNTLDVPHGEGYLTLVMRHLGVGFVLRGATKEKIILGEGAYNTAYLVRERNGTKQHVLRIMKPTYDRDDISDMKGELRLTKRFSKLSIGTPVSKTVMYKVQTAKGTGYGTAMLMARMDSDLHGVIKTSGKSKVLFNANTLAKTLIKSIHNLANEGYMCADIKPQNVLVKGNVAFMADFDTKFCGRGSFIDRIAKKYGINQVALIANKQLNSHSWKHLRDMYSRAMVFMLIQFIAGKKVYRNVRGILFRKALVDMYEKHYLSKARGPRKILLGGTQVPAMEVLRYSIPGFLTQNRSGQLRYYNVKNMVQHYHGRDIFAEQLAQKWFGSFE